MIAFTFGRVILRLAQDGTPIGADTVTQALIRIASGASVDRVSPEMAKSALMVSIGVEECPLIGVQKGPLWRCGEQA
ncbi:hypothetical protein, partial [Paracoccus sp. AS002]|uniref:hypothetical protein n=1 Tax=Paracoccus sp. AS002 TaxID=3019545 RepID=UPI0023E7C33B